jgi:hypothetical protein
VLTVKPLDSIQEAIHERLLLTSYGSKNRIFISNGIHPCKDCLRWHAPMNCSVYSVPSRLPIYTILNKSAAPPSHSYTAMFCKQRKARHTVLQRLTQHATEHHTAAPAPCSSWRSTSHHGCTSQISHASRARRAHQAHVLEQRALCTWKNTFAWKKQGEMHARAAHVRMAKQICMAKSMAKPCAHGKANLHGNEHGNPHLDRTASSSGWHLRQNSALGTVQGLPRPHGNTHLPGRHIAVS